MSVTMIKILFIKSICLQIIKSSNGMLAERPCGLSINCACNLIVACYADKAKIQEYNTTSGSLVREISLELNDVELRPLHAIQLLTSDQFVVSCYNVTSQSYDVVEVDTKRRQVVVSYTNQLKSTTQHKFSSPRHLSVDKNNEFILVADTDNNRIVILNRSLKCDARELNVMMSVDGGLQHLLVFILTHHKIDYLSVNSAVSVVCWCLTTSFNSRLQFSINFLRCHFDQFKSLACLSFVSRVFIQFSVVIKVIKNSIHSPDGYITDLPR
jgi:hypothetical protein